MVNILKENGIMKCQEFLEICIDIFLLKLGISVQILIVNYCMRTSGKKYIYC